MIATSVMAVKATPKAIRLIEESRKEKGEDLTNFEKVKVVGPAYIPSILIGAATIACIFSANSLNKRQQAALISAYALLDSSYREYRDKVFELYGEEADKEVRTGIAKDNYDGEEEDTDDGKLLFYDAYSNRYFRTTNEIVLSAEYKINKILQEDCYASLNELYDLLDIPKVDYGEHMGWSSAQMFDMYWSSWLNFSHEKVLLDDNLECTIITMTDPMVDFGEY